MLSSLTLIFLESFEQLTSLGRFKLLEALVLTNFLPLSSSLAENDSNPLLVLTTKQVQKSLM